MDDTVDEYLLEDMISDIGAESFAKTYGYKSMLTDANTFLYLGSTNFTRLSEILRLMNLKAINGWIDKSFTKLCLLWKEMLPKGNTLTNRNYETTKYYLSNGYGV